MISQDDLTKIKKLTVEFWTDQAQSTEFQMLYRGKERGHRIADYVDEQTTALLHRSVPSAYQLDAKGSPVKRSMGDVWIFSGDMYNPLNVKAGVAGMNGNPNLVALNKLLVALMKSEIDSYYLLIVKMQTDDPVETEGAGLESMTGITRPNVYLVDMFESLDFVSFDAGPGQTMLKEKEFYAFMESGGALPSATLREKVERLLALLEDGNRRLAANRKRKLSGMQNKMTNYTSRIEHAINQEKIHFG